MGQIEPVHPSDLDPALQLVRDRLGPAHRLGHQPAEAQVLDNAPLGPGQVVGARDGGGPAPHHGLHAGRLAQQAEVGIVRVAGEVQPRPAAEQGEGALLVDVAQVLLARPLGVLVGGGHDNRHAHEDLDVVGPPPLGCGHGAQVVDDDARRLGRLAAHEDGLAMLAAEAAAGLGHAGLEQQRRALRGRLAEVRAGDGEVPALVVDRPHRVWLDVDAAFPVGDDGVVPEAALPQLVEHVHVLVGDGVALVVRDLLAQPQVARRAVEVRRHDVPGQAAVGEVVEGGEAAGEGVGLLVGDARRDAKHQPLGGGGHVGHQVQGVVDGELGARGQRRRHVARALVDVVGAQGVGNEHGVEAGLVEQLGQVHPEGQLLVLVRLVPRVSPLAGRQVTWRVHDEGIEDHRLLAAFTAAPTARHCVCACHDALF